MRKVILSMMVSVDGYTEGQNPEENWHNWNNEMTAYMMGFLKNVDTFIYGRKSYEEMISFWPKLTDEFASAMNQTPKLVFSQSLNEVTWNSKLISEDPVEIIPQLKKKTGKNMVLFAGASLAESFINKNLIDEFRLIVNPLVMGGRKPLFKNIHETIHLNLKDSVHFTCGNILLVYEPDSTNSP